MISLEIDMWKVQVRVGPRLAPTLPMPHVKIREPRPAFHVSCWWMWERHMHTTQGRSSGNRKKRNARAHS